MLKKCPNCGKVLPDTEFSKNQQYCKICARDYQWQYKYGISPDQYYEMYKAQDGKCKICGKEVEAGYLHVDHNEKTGEVRGLLCSNHNTGIGLFGEDVELMKRAIQYIEKDGDI